VLVGAGVIRSLVWDHLHGYLNPTPVKAVDVVYFDGSNLSQKRDQDILGQLMDMLPDVPWESGNTTCGFSRGRSEFRLLVIMLGW